MKIALDCSKAVNESAGVAKYTKQLTKNLLKLCPHDQFFLYFNFLRGKGKKIVRIKEIIGNSENAIAKIYPLPGWLKERLFYSPISITNYCFGKYDLYHATEFLSFDNGLKIPQVLTVYDLTMIIFPEHRGKGNESTRHGKILRKACRNAQMIISISQATSRDIQKYFTIPKEKIKVIYPGLDPDFRKNTNGKKIKSTLLKYKINFPYILFVGTIEPRKNIVNLIAAFNQFSQLDIDQKFSLVLVGQKGWNYQEIFAAYRKSPFKERIIFLEYVAQEDLPALYYGAKLFCYPSLYEGFGLPVLEAMACGVPVITSNVSSLPEVGGQAAYYVDPNDPRAICIGIKKILSNYQLAQKMVELGFRQVKKFSWEKCAQETYQVYQGVYVNQTKK